jgi:hypothetical protein
VLLWFVGTALVLVWVVFHDPAIDHRVVIAGAVLPDLVDGPFGGARVAHTVVASAALLVTAMLVTRGRRAARRRWLALPIGTFIHLLADGVWSDRDTFWWPFFGGRLDAPLPSLDHGLAVVLLQELAGLVAVVWFVHRFGLMQPAPRAAFLRTGRLPRDRVG